MKAPRIKSNKKKETKNQMKTSIKITMVTYWRGDGNNSGKASATFDGHLSQSEIERKMLFERQTPKRRIETTEHKFN